MYKLLKPEETAKLIEAYYELFEKTKGTATVELKKYGSSEYCAMHFESMKESSTVNIGGIDIPTEEVKPINIDTDMLKVILTKLFREYGLDVMNIRICIEPAQGYDSRQLYPKEKPAHLDGISVEYGLIDKKDDVNVAKR